MYKSADQTTDRRGALQAYLLPEAVGHLDPAQLHLRNKRLWNFGHPLPEVNQHSSDSLKSRLRYFTHVRPLKLPRVISSTSSVCLWVLSLCFGRIWTRRSVATMVLFLRSEHLTLTLFSLHSLASLEHVLPLEFLRLKCAPKRMS